MDFSTFFQLLRRETGETEKNHKVKNVIKINQHTSKGESQPLNINMTLRQKTERFDLLRWLINALEKEKHKVFMIFPLFFIISLELMEVS